MRYFVQFRNGSWEVVQKLWMFQHVAAQAPSREAAIALMVQLATKENMNGQTRTIRSS
jgi:hypothetical protein